MTVVPALVAENIYVLRGGAELVATLPAEMYARPGPYEPRSGVGTHIRHCIEFYASFLDGMDAGRVDYSARARDVRLEVDRSLACERIGEIAHSLESVGADRFDQTLLVRAESDGALDVWCASSIGRELQVLSSHTIHHFAIVALTLRVAGLEVPEAFGVAPSTLRHWRSEACAR